MGRRRAARGRAMAPCPCCGTTPTTLRASRSRRYVAVQIPNTSRPTIHRASRDPSADYLTPPLFPLSSPALFDLAVRSRQYLALVAAVGCHASRPQVYRWPEIDQSFSWLLFPTSPAPRCHRPLPQFAPPRRANLRVWESFLLVIRPLLLLPTSSPSSPSSTSSSSSSFPCLPCPAVHTPYPPRSCAHPTQPPTQPLLTFLFPLPSLRTSFSAGGGAGDERVLHRVRHHAPRGRQDLPVPQLVSEGGTHVLGMGLHSFTSQLNLSAFHGIGGARRYCVARAKGV